MTLHARIEALHLRRLSLLDARIPPLKVPVQSLRRDSRRRVFLLNILEFHLVGIARNEDDVAQLQSSAATLFGFEVTTASLFAYHKGVASNQRIIQWCPDHFEHM